MNTMRRVTGDPKDVAREAAAAAAADRVEPGMTIGLGSGRAVWKVVEALGDRNLEVRAAAASVRTEELAAQVGIDLVDLDAAVPLDLAIDGADEIDPHLGLIKGAGGALLVLPRGDGQCAGAKDRDCGSTAAKGLIRGRDTVLGTHVCPEVE